MNSGQKAPLALTPEELRALLEATLAHNDREAFVMFLIGVAHGLRVSELIELRRRDFEETATGIQLTVQRLKNSNKTTQELLSAPNPLLDELTVVREWIKDLKPNDRLFNLGDRFAVGRRFEKYAKLAGVSTQKRHIHVLKHTTGILLRKSGADIVVIQQVLGHRSVQSSMQYMRLTTEEVEEGRQRAFAMAAGVAMAAGA
jgi:integrase/recombinase XerD